MSTNLTAPTQGRNLTNLQVSFLDALFGEAKGDPRIARELAGYGKKTPLALIMRPLAAEIAEGTRQYLAQHAPEAVATLIEIMTTEFPPPGSKLRLDAAKEVLDRSGLVKKEQKEVVQRQNIKVRSHKNKKYKGKKS